MSDLQEKGFLSDKFENWSSEPIPNGWANIESVLEQEKRKKPAFWFWFLPLAFLVSGIFGYLGYKSGKTSESNQTNTIGSINELLSNKLEMGLEKKTANQTEKNQPIASSDNEASEATVAGPLSDNSLATNAPDLKHSLPGNRNQKSKIKKAINGVGAPSGQGIVIASNQKSKSQKGAIVASLAHGYSGVNLSDSYSSDGLSRGNSERNSDLNEGENSHPGNLKNGNEEGFSGSMAKIVNVENLELLELDTKMAVLSLPELHPGDPKYIVLPPLPRRNKKSPFQVFAGISFGHASKNMNLNQREAVNQLKIKDLVNPGATWFSQLESQVQVSIFSWLKLLSAAQIGVYHQTLEIENTSKTPGQFAVVKKDSLRFGLEPQKTKWTETRTQNLVYGNFEFGLKPLIIKELQSGPFASILLWTTISQDFSSNFSGSTPFMAAKSTYAFGYKIGYQHLFLDRWNLQLYATELPGEILVQSQGLAVSPRFFGLGVQYLVK